jgi:hypothetical protein
MSMNLKLIVIAALMLSMVGLAGCFDEDYGPYGYYPGYYGYGYGPGYYGGWWGDGDWDDYPHYHYWHHWDDGGWGHGWRHGHWHRGLWTAPGGGFAPRLNQARGAQGPVFARNEFHGFGGGFHASAPAARAGGGFHGGGGGFHGGGHRR